MSASDLQDAAAALPISPTTLGRAKNDLRIISTKSEFDGGWVWGLPDVGPPAHDTETELLDRRCLTS